MDFYRIDDFEAIIFDFGGVIIDIDYQKTLQAMVRLFGGHQEQLMFTQSHQSNVFDQIETGQINEADFRNYLRSKGAEHLSDSQIDQAWNALLGGIPSYKFDFLRQIASQTRIFLLSNTNSIHLRAIEPTMAKVAGSRQGFESVFEKVYYSHKVGLRKPHPEIFEMVIQENGLDPSRALFIDDSVQHVKGAQKVGLKAHHLVGDVTKIWR